MLSMWNSSFDFPRPRGMAIIWLLPYVGMQLFPLPLKITNQNAAVGDVHHPWNPNIDAYQLADILQLVIFYNNNLGIDADDPIDVRRLKVRAWLVEDSE
jgi:hypothetical protein